jgi:ABC-type transport system involved in multi-copper enzyme maturation permease subunit
MFFNSKDISSKHLAIAAALAFFMLLTRGSHVLTHVALPDASLALLLIGGLYLRKTVWLVGFVMLATGIDFSAAAIDSLQAYCLTIGYWGMLPTYAAMWLAGVWLGKQSNGLDALKFSLAAVVSTLVAFVISTQTYYLFSGRFPNHGLVETMQYGWNYLPSYLAYTAMYLVGFWALAKASSKLNFIKSPTSHTA